MKIFVSTNWVFNNIKNKKLIILDCTWYLPNTKGKDINEMILNGQTIDKILNNINMNTYSGQRGEWEVRMWKV